MLCWLHQLQFLLRELSPYDFLSFPLLTPLAFSFSSSSFFVRFSSTIRLLRFRGFEDNVSRRRINVLPAFIHFRLIYDCQISFRNLNEESYNIFKLMQMGSNIFFPLSFSLSHLLHFSIILNYIKFHVMDKFD